MKPRIALPQPTSNDLPYNQRSWQQYASAIERSGGEPVLMELALPLAGLRERARSCNGVLLPGSPADVDPALYGAERTAECAPADPARERLDYMLLEDAFGCVKPVLGICYGVQSINAWRGGSLVQDLTPLPVNHSAGGSVAVAHTAVVAENSLLASLLTPDEAPASGGLLRLPVNSSHHQAIAAPGEGLRIVARCPDDGVIEAVELDAALPAGAGSMFHVEHAGADEAPFFMGVQWHPERSFDISPASRALFLRLVLSARANARLRSEALQSRAKHPAESQQSDPELQDLTT